jgi:hypothetical protein
VLVDLERLKCRAACMLARGSNWGIAPLAAVRRRLRQLIAWGLGPKAVSI